MLISWRYMTKCLFVEYCHCIIFFKGNLAFKNFSKKTCPLIVNVTLPSKHLLPRLQSCNNVSSFNALASTVICVGFKGKDGASAWIV